MIPNFKSLAGFYVRHSSAPKTGSYPVITSGSVFFQVVGFGFRPSGYAAHHV